MAGSDTKGMLYFLPLFSGFRHTCVVCEKTFIMAIISYPTQQPHRSIQEEIISHKMRIN